MPPNCEPDPPALNVNTTGAGFTLAVSSNAAGSYSFGVQGVGGDLGAITHVAPVTLNFFDFTIAPDPERANRECGANCKLQFDLHSRGSIHFPGGRELRLRHVAGFDHMLVRSGTDSERERNCKGETDHHYHCGDRRAGKTESIAAQAPAVGAFLPAGRSSGRIRRNGESTPPGCPSLCGTSRTVGTRYVATGMRRRFGRRRWQWQSCTSRHHARHLHGHDQCNRGERISGFAGACSSADIKGAVSVDPRLPFPHPNGDVIF